MAKAVICGIYRIAFPNGKSYIGKTNNFYRRKYEHYRASHPEKYPSKNERDEKMPVHLAMRKYENNGGYEYEILEECPEEKLDEREKYWCNYYHSDIEENGYNVAKPGTTPFGLSGERHSQAKMTLAQVNKIKEMLETRLDLSCKEIAKQFNVSPATITLINVGKN